MRAPHLLEGATAPKTWPYILSLYLPKDIAGEVDRSRYKRNKRRYTFDSLYDHIFVMAINERPNKNEIDEHKKKNIIYL